MIVTTPTMRAWMLRVFMNDEPGAAGGGSDDPGDFGDMPEAVDPDAPPAEDPDTDAPPAEDDDPEEEWKEGDATLKAKRSELRKAYLAAQQHQARDAETSQREQQASQALQHLTAMHQQTAQQLQAGVAHMQRLLVGEQPDGRLIETNPQEYMRQQAVYNHRVQEFQQLMQAQQHVQSQQQQLQQAQMNQRLAAEERQLLAAVPEWRDPTARKAEGTRISAYLASRGLTPEEIGGLYDHRSLLVARDAQRWHEYQATKTKRVAPAVPAPRTVRPGPAPTPASRGNVINTRALDERLARNRNDEDALTARFEKVW